MLGVKTLAHGGLMVNYQCTAACRHCLYSCSPTRGTGYVDEATMEKTCSFLRKGDCMSVHIGGGEPFLDFDGLLMVIRKLKLAGIALKYIETNAYWACDASAQKKLECLLLEGPQTFCISIDPYHAEYVPCGLPLVLAELCEKTGVDYFFWRQEFLPVLSLLDKEKALPRAELEKVLDRYYIHTTAQAHSIRYGGRAINIERDFGSLFPVESFAAENTPCHKLLSTRHFHVDMYGYFIPPGCTGIRLPLEEVVDGIPADKYPAFEALYSGGILALLKLARQYGFSAASEGYPSKCNLCFHLRHFLAGKNFLELDREHYEEALKYWE